MSLDPVFKIQQSFTWSSLQSGGGTVTVPVLKVHEGKKGFHNFTLDASVPKRTFKAGLSHL